MKTFKVLFVTAVVMLSLGFINTIIAQINLQNGLVAYYPFNNNGDDQSGNGNDGIIYGAIPSPDRFGNPNKSYYFNGVTDYIRVNKQFFNNGWSAYSISGWFNSSDLSKVRQCVFNTLPHAGLDIQINYFSTNKMSFFINADPGTPENRWNINYINALGQKSDYYINTWYHYVFIKKGNNYKLFLNGVLDADFNGSLSPKSYLCGVIFGSIDTAYNMIECFNGNLDDIRIYNRALNEQEIQALYNEQAFSITVSSNSSATVGKIIEIPISTSIIHSIDSIISYQFKLKYDSSVLKYIDCNLIGTIAAGGTINSNDKTPGQLNAGYINSAPITGTGAIANLRFKVIGRGTSPLTISDFLYNTDSITRITNGYVISLIQYGDIDFNDYVQAFDAALALQYSAGIDPMPSSAPLPWDALRITTADVDGVTGITAYDASLILQKSLGIIANFPVENSKRYKQSDNADVILKVENNEIIFYSKGNLYGVNVSTDNSGKILGTPVFLDNNAIEVFNNKDYAAAVATAYSAGDNTAFMKIPYTKRGTVTFSMIVNSRPKLVTLDLGSYFEELPKDVISIYPNPVHDILTISGIVKPTLLNIYTVNGQLLEINTLYNSINVINLNYLPAGVYIIRLKADQEITIKRIVKQ